jgi:AcrR family transcriptional regulator
MVTPDFIRGALEDHGVDISQPDEEHVKLGGGDVDYFGDDDHDETLVWIERVVDGIFDQRSSQDDCEVNLDLPEVEPSLSASYLTTRRGGGAMSLIWDQMSKAVGYNQGNTWKQELSWILDSANETDLDTMIEPKPGTVISVYRTRRAADLLLMYNPEWRTLLEVLYHGVTTDGVLVDGKMMAVHDAIEWIKRYRENRKKELFERAERRAQEELEQLLGLTAADVQEMLDQVDVPGDDLDPSTIDRAMFRMVWYHLEVEDFATQDRIHATAVGIPEPFKVRVITKGEAVPYYESRRLQQFLTQRMKNCIVRRFFPALRGDIDADVLMKTFPAARWGGFFNSGDYKGATDTMRSDLSRYAIQYICNKIPLYRGNHLSKLMEMCLCDHIIHYPDPYTKGATCCDDTIQCRGQLMGSFLSFPILNIVNLAINLQFLHFHKKITDRFDSWSLAPVIVNGDDVLIFSEDNIFVLNEDQRVDDTAWHCQMSDLPDLRDWTNFVRVVGGFKKSVGKNYISDKFLTINSCLFTRDIETSEWNFIQQIKCPRVENFFNEVWYTHVRATDLGFQREVNTHGAAGFVPKQRRAVQCFKDDSFQAGPQMAGTLVRDLVAFSSNQHLAISLFVEYHLAHLKATKRPWFLPSDLGGLGLPCIPEMRDFWVEDAKLCSFILRLNHTQKVSPLKVGRGAIPSRPCDQKASAFDMQLLERCGAYRTLSKEKIEKVFRPHHERTWMDYTGSRTDLVIECEESLLKKSIFSDDQVLAKLRKQSQAVTDLVPFDLTGEELRAYWIICENTPGEGYYDSCGSVRDALSDDEVEERGNLRSLLSSEEKKLFSRNILPETEFDSSMKRFLDYSTDE